MESTDERQVGKMTFEHEKETLVHELVAMHNIQENPDFEEQVREILEKYIVFYKDRLTSGEYKTLLQIQEDF